MSSRYEKIGGMWLTSRVSDTKIRVREGVWCVWCVCDDASIFVFSNTISIMLLCVCVCVCL